MKPYRIGAALTALGLVTALGACAMPGGSKAKSASIFGGKVDQANIGLATRAQAALLSGDTPGAIAWAEKAVAGSPNDAGFRALLANIYFTAGRFASAETAYRDSLSLLSNQPQLVLKMALSQIAQGKSAQARGLLASAGQLLDPSDYGLALALAGDRAQAILILDEAARSVGADSRVRQNLALAHALSGDWQAARTIAAQDLDSAQVEARVQQWMAMASPQKASDQVASLLGVAPAAVDPGQPTRLALKLQDDRYAFAAAVAPAPVAAPVPEVAEAPVSDAVDYAAAEPVAPVAVAAVAPQPQPVATAPVPAPIAAALAAIAPVMPAFAKPEAAPAAAPQAPRPSLSPRAASLSDDVPALRKEAAKKAPRAGTSRAVVQLASYSARDRVTVGWNRLSGKYPALRGYSPTTARYDLGNGSVYRLSVKGFDSRKQAVDLCMSLKKSGATCFVRDVAGDLPAGVRNRG